MKKLKTYVITVSRYFPQYHPRKGEETGFVEKIQSGEKIHTIRGSIELWQKRIEQVQKGEAVLSLRYWSGRPYNSPQVEFKVLTAADNIEMQQVYINLDIPSIPAFYMSEYKSRDIDGFPLVGRIPENDGLSIVDFAQWFLKGGYDLSKPMVIIHFTNFRY